MSWRNTGNSYPVTTSTPVVKTSNAGSGGGGGSKSSGFSTPSCNGSCMDFLYRYRILIGIILAISALLLVILLPISFSYVEPGEVALPKGRVSGDVDEGGKVYRMNLDRNGRYFLGVSTSLQTFDNRIQQEVFDMSVVASGSRGFTLTIAAFYRLVEDELGELFTKFNTGWKTPAKNEIISAIKSTTGGYVIDDYVDDLETIRSEMAIRVNAELAINHMQGVKMTILILRCDFTGEVDNQYLRAVVQQQNNEKQLIQRDVDIIVQDTETQRRAIVANTTLITATGQAEATRIVETGRAQANRIQELARTDGFTELFSHFNVTNSTTKTQFLEWFAMDNNINNIRLLKGVDNALVTV